MRLKELERWLTPAEAGKVIGISKQAVVKRLENATIRGVKTHQGWLVDPKDAEKVKQEREQGHKREQPGLAQAQPRLNLEKPEKGEG